MEHHTVLRPNDAIELPDGLGRVNDRIARQWRRELTNGSAGGG